MKMELQPPPACLPTILSEHGYKTAIVGKTHWWPSDTDFGCDEAHLTIDTHLTPELGENDAYLRFLEGKGLFHYDPTTWDDDKVKLNPDNLPFECLKANWVGDVACDIVDRFSCSEEPFFLFCSFVEPHGPGKTPKWYTEQLRTGFMPPLLDGDGERPGRPETQKRAVERWKRPKEVVERSRLEVFAGIRMVDENIGKLLNRIDAAGCADETLVLFITDHGDLLFDHGCIEKTFLYDHAVRIPFLLRGPEIPEGRRYEEPVSHIDLLPTLLEHAGINEDPDWHIEGRSLLPVAQGKEVDWRKTLFCEVEQSVHLRDLVDSSSAKMALRWPWKYIYTLVNGHIVEEELYNLEDDPEELTNRAGDSSLVDTVLELRNEVLRWLVATEASRLHPHPKNHYPVPRVSREYL
jgi:arylsulfatase A-like enzyme